MVQPVKPGETHVSHEKYPYPIPLYWLVSSYPYCGLLMCIIIPIKPDSIIPNDLSTMVFSMVFLMAHVKSLILRW